MYNAQCPPLSDVDHRAFAVTEIRSRNNANGVERFVAHDRAVTAHDGSPIGEYLSTEITSADGLVHIAVCRQEDDHSCDGKIWRFGDFVGADGRLRISKSKRRSMERHDTTPFMVRIGKATRMLHNAQDGIEKHNEAQIRTAYETVMSVNAEWLGRSLTPVDYLQWFVELGADVRIVHPSWWMADPADGAWGSLTSIATLHDFNATRHVAIVNATCILSSLDARLNLAGATSRVCFPWVMLHWMGSDAPLR